MPTLQLASIDVYKKQHMLFEVSEDVSNANGVVCRTNCSKTMNE